MFLLLFSSGDQLARTSSTLKAKRDQSTVAQRVEMTVCERAFPDELVCELVSLIGSWRPDTMPGDHSQPTSTSLGQV